MGFSGWPAEAVEFFRGLQDDNTKAYWTAHQTIYEASVREPMAELLSELSAEFGPGRIARPYRDIRFRADKSPYKTVIYATMGRGGYVNFSAEGLTAGTGYFMMSAAQLGRYRDAVAGDAEGAGLARVVQRLRAEGFEVGGGQTLKSAPRGIPQGPSPDRTAPLQGPDLLAALAGGAVAAYGEGQGQGGRLPAHRCAAAPMAGSQRRTRSRLTSPSPAGRPATLSRDRSEC